MGSQARTGAEGAAAGEDQGEERGEGCPLGSASVSEQTSREDPPAFTARVLEWLQFLDGGHPEAARIESVEADGTDWRGTTEAGFDSQFTVMITWRGHDGLKGWEDYGGEKLASLWRWVVSGWPA